MTAGELFLMIERFNLSWDDFIKRVRAKLSEAGQAMR